MSNSKIFVGLKSVRGKSAQPAPSGPQCDWDGCEEHGGHRAPVGQGAEGLHFVFCREHVREYNKRYNYAPALSSPEVARYQREVLAGSRRAWGAGVRQATETPLPSTARSGTAKAINARRSAAERQAQGAELQRRRLRVLEAKAFETLGLHPDATPKEIRSRYKERLKMHHPDANHGSRTSEAELRASIEAHRILKLNGFC